jgi:hypothetical protein
MTTTLDEAGCGSPLRGTEEPPYAIECACREAIPHPGPVYTTPAAQSCPAKRSTVASISAVLDCSGASTVSRTLHAHLLRAHLRQANIRLVILTNRGSFVYRYSSVGPLRMHSYADIRTTVHREWRMVGSEDHDAKIARSREVDRP